MTCPRCGEPMAIEPCRRCLYPAVQVVPISYAYAVKHFHGPEVVTHPLTFQSDSYYTALCLEFNQRFERRGV